MATLDKWRGCEILRAANDAVEPNGGEPSAPAAACAMTDGQAPAIASARIKFRRVNPGDARLADRIFFSSFCYCSQIIGTKGLLEALHPKLVA